MCDPTTIAYVAVGVLAGGAVATMAADKPAPATATPDTTKADAQASANAQLAADQKRRRQQANLLTGGNEATGTATAQLGAPGITQTPKANAGISKPGGATVLGQGRAPYDSMIGRQSANLY